MNPLHRVDGEVIGLGRWNSMVGGCTLVLGCLCLGQGALLVALLEWTAAPGILVATGVVSGLLFWLSWYMLLRPQSLVLGRDRLQWHSGRRAIGEVPYEQVAEISLFANSLGRRFLGIRLKNLEHYDALYTRQPWTWRTRMRRVWNRYGFDLAISVSAATEPPERVLEATLRCLHRFRAAAGQG